MYMSDSTDSVLYLPDSAFLQCVGDHLIAKPYSNSTERDLFRAIVMTENLLVKQMR